MVIFTFGVVYLTSVTKMLKQDFVMLKSKMFFSYILVMPNDLMFHVMANLCVYEGIYSFFMEVFYHAVQGPSATQGRVQQSKSNTVYGDLL